MRAKAAMTEMIWNFMVDQACKVKNDFLLERTAQKVVGFI